MSPVAVLSFSRISRDRRVLRQCDLLRDMGHTPHVIAYARPGDPLAYPVSSMVPPQPTVAHRLSTVIRQMPAHLSGRLAEVGFWAARRHKWALEQLRVVRPRVVVANDWPALVVASRWKSESGARIHYDSHEFAPLEFDESAWWRLVYKPFVQRLEAAHIHHADSVSTVGPRLALELQKHYNLPDCPAVVRNIPGRIALPSQPQTEWPLRILYHGQLLPQRGLEALIDSVAAWRVPHTLTIRGDGPEGYVRLLHRKVEQSRLNQRISFVPALPPDDVMPVAAETADLGVHFTPLETTQRHFSLPNKLFEYIGAGLAVAISPGLDLRDIVERHGVGVVSRTAGAPAIAETINALTCADVAAFRQNARQASQILCWEAEQGVLRKVLEPLMKADLPVHPPP